MDHDKDYYDGLIDVSLPSQELEMNIRRILISPDHSCIYVTVSNTFIHDHWKASLIGHSDSNGDEDTGHLHVTENNNYWYNVNSRGPSIRFGTGHIYNSYFEEVNDGINTRDGVQVLVESSTFVGCDKPLYSTDDGYAVAKDNDFGDCENTAEAGSLTSVPYKYTLLGSGNVRSSVVVQLVNL